MISFKNKIDKLKLQQNREITALITGASSGMGLLYATHLAEAGCNLLIISNQEKELKEVAENLRKDYDVNVIARYQDLSQDDAAQQLFDYCKKDNIIN